MIDPKDSLTASIPGLPAKRGRPPLPPGVAKTPAQRTAEYRARKGIVTVTLTADSAALLVTALRAAESCRMLRREDKAVFSSLLQKLAG